MPAPARFVRRLFWGANSTRRAQFIPKIQAEQDQFQAKFLPAFFCRKALKNRAKTGIIPLFAIVQCKSRNFPSGKKMRLFRANRSVTRHSAVLRPDGSWVPGPPVVLFVDERMPLVHRF